MKLRVRQFGRRPYAEVFSEMQNFTESRHEGSDDELWVTEHEPVFTQGQAGKAEHVLFPGDIPVLQTDRGGQVTYHGPGQLVVYLMLDIRRAGITPRALVTAIEQALVACLAGYGISATPRKDAPGVYVDQMKIASLGLRIRRGRSYHGLSFNIDMDLEPFSRINPCGMQGLKVTQLVDLGGPADLMQVSEALLGHLAEQLALAGSQKSPEPAVKLSQN